MDADDVMGISRILKLPHKIRSLHNYFCFEFAVGLLLEGQQQILIIFNSIR